MTFLIILVLWIFSVCLHEYAHARVAFAGGDFTVKSKGYLSFNPLLYADPLYSVIVPLIFLAVGGLALPGAAVYIENWRLRSRAWESLVSAAGPLANLALALVVSAALHTTPVAASDFSTILAFFGVLQICAVVLSLLPVPPLDGYGIIAPYLNPELRQKANQASQWSIWALFLVLFFIPPVSRAFWNLVFGLSEFIGLPMDLAIQGFRAFKIM